MKLTSALAICSLLFVSCPTVTSRNVLRTELAPRDDAAAIERAVDAASVVVEAPSFAELEKRKGGGGRGGGGGGGGKGGGGGGRSGGGSGGRSGGGGSGGRGGSSNTQPTSNRGGLSSGGSGMPRSFGGGSYYMGGSTKPYTAGGRSPLGLTPSLLPVGALAFFPGLWLYGVYAYPMTHPYSYHNDTSNDNETLPVTCLCQQYWVCGCDDNDDNSYINSVFNDTDGDGIPDNSSDLRVANVNGTRGIYVNGTLPNGTTAPDGSEEDASGKLLKLTGYWVMVAVSVAAVTLL